MLEQYFYNQLDILKKEEKENIYRKEKLLQLNEILYAKDKKRYTIYNEIKTEQIGNKIQEKTLMNY